MRWLAKHELRFQNDTLYRGNGKRRETKLETKSFPPPEAMFLLGKMKIQGNEAEHQTGNEGKHFCPYSFPLDTIQT
mgnify:FL=1